mmetsp:Transcript_26802/g.53434  ORF Transcript_26802/g.53434 Transcript_26802/m.53434 type:complete len:201 (-) Transcript_26802:275-877(-)
MAVIAKARVEGHLALPPHLLPLLELVALLPSLLVFVHHNVWWALAKVSDDAHLTVPRIADGPSPIPYPRLLPTVSARGVVDGANGQGVGKWLEEAEHGGAEGPVALGLRDVPLRRLESKLVSEPPRVLLNSEVPGLPRVPLGREEPEDPAARPDAAPVGAPRHEPASHNFPAAPHEHLRHDPVPRSRLAVGGAYGGVGEV